MADNSKSRAGIYRTRKRIAGASVLNPHLKRRKVPKGVDFVGEEREKLKVVVRELEKKQRELEKEQLIIFQANRRMYDLREEIDEISQKKDDLEKEIRDNDEMCLKFKK